MNDETMWQAKVLAYLHDPAEKALILLRGGSHEAGTVADMRELLGVDLAQLYESVGTTEQVLKTADRWAAAADRPSLPKTLKTRVVFATHPQIIHPLTGQTFKLTELASDAHYKAVEAVSFAHFKELVVWENEAERRPDWKKTFLKLWRFGPETPAKNLGVLWNVLPADTRSPDHTIWEHLKLTSAFAGAIVADLRGPALLLISFGPVQSFITQARSVSDLWAGSHLLSRIAWEGMRLICDRFGPDAVLFPDLHGVAVTDLWIKEQLGGWRDGVAKPWAEENDDTNPLFAAALPNRFVALVPASGAEALAKEIAKSVRCWAKKEARAALDELLEAAGRSEASHAQTQIDRQFADFPEVHWAVIPWQLAGSETLDDGRLKTVLERLGAEPAYLGEKLDGLLRGEIKVEGHEFYSPNPGPAYPGLYEALERLHAAAKAVRPFDGKSERGYRCTLCGEREWVTDDAILLDLPSGQRKEKSLWEAVARNKPALAKEGEHLCGVCALKRAWPRLFVKEVAQALPELGRVDRFALSTRAVAMATSLWRWLERGNFSRWEEESDAAFKTREEAGQKLRLLDLSGRRAALPKRLYGRLRKQLSRDEDVRLVKALPALLDEVHERADNTEKARQATRLDALVSDFLGAKAETYYALVLMDGDRMGAWLSGEAGCRKMAERFHQTVLGALQRTGKFGDYLTAPRPASPARHQAISTALNGFALHLARVVVEDLFMGKLIYAGGDDLMAMVAVHDLPGLMLALRCAYSGVLPEGVKQDTFWQWITGESQDRLRIANGFALLKDWHDDKKEVTRMFRLMGGEATASIGAIVAHEQAPLARVLRDLRAAERKAKGEGGRDAFCLTVDKRAGGTSHLVGKWRFDAGRDGDLGLLLDLRDLVAHRVSRQAVYLLAGKLRDVPTDALEPALRYQFNRQASEADKDAGSELAQRLARAAVAYHGGPVKNEWTAANRWLHDLLLTAEFLAREGRVAEDRKAGRTPVKEAADA